MPLKTKSDSSLLIGATVPGARRRNNFWVKLLGGVSALLGVGLSLAQAAQSVTLAWDANSESNIAGYFLRYGTASGKPSQRINVGKNTRATVSNLADSTTYYFTVTARNTHGLESPPSSEISYLTPPLGAHRLTVINGTGSGYYTEGTLVPVSAKQPEKGQRFERWIGDYQILLDPPNTMRTQALMLFRDLTIQAVYSSATGSDKIRYYPRRGFAARMRGGVFEGSNGDPMTGPYTPIYTISVRPPETWSEVSVNLANFRYLRYRGPNGSYGNVSEIEFYRGGAKLNGAGYGTPGSWNNDGNTFVKAIDGNVSTFFDAPADTGYVGIDTGSGGSSQLTSIWQSTDVPQVADSGPDEPVELGVKFLSDVAGRITGVRFYKASANTGRHVGNLWTSSGTLLATATFNGETASGWQQVNFATPVPINANTVYVASYHCDSGHYSADLNYFSATSGENNPPLHAVPSTSSNRNGVYAYGDNSVFPSQSWNSCNYWVDVVFQQ